MIAAVTDEVKVLFAEFKTEIDKDFQERDVARLQEIETRLNDSNDQLQKLIEKEEARYSLPGSEPTGDPTKDFSFGRAAAAIHRRDWKGAGVEKEIFDEMAERRDLGTQAGAGGSYIVPIQQTSDIIDRLRERVIVEKLGARVLDGNMGFPLYIPRLSSSISAAWVAENGTIPSSDVGFDQMELRPRELAAISKLSMKLVQNSSPAADAIVREDFVRQFAVAVDEAAMNGTGNQQPIGVTQTAGVQAHSFAGSVLSYPGLVNMMFKLASANADFGKLGWAMNTDIARRIQTIGSETTGTGEGSTKIEPARAIFSEAPLSRLLGKPFETTANAAAMPTTGAGAIVYGNWDDLMLAYWKNLELRATDTGGTSFETNQVWIRGITSVDVGVRQPDSFVVGTV